MFLALLHASMLAHKTVKYVTCYVTTCSLLHEYPYKFSQFTVRSDCTDFLCCRYNKSTVETKPRNKLYNQAKKTE